MADTTLKAYYAYLDDLLTRRRYDEVAAHAQHILARYPKNLGAWRRLGKAQLENGQFDEALKAFGQVLGFMPQDIDAYVGLSWVYRQRSDADRTIYFLERAYEREPGNNEIIGLLRDAYRIFHDRANAKLPNTPYMVARQQLKSGLATQAVKTLQDALHESPNRADLRMLLAEVYAQIGQPVEAAKTAVAVVKALPDCLRANQILAVVWLEAGRPSDAQRMVSRIEEVDPYLAYEIATGESPPDEAFTLPLLNYGSKIGQVVNNASPDWLSDISPEAVPQDSVAAELDTSAVSADLAEPDTDWLKAIKPVEADVPSVAQSNEDWLAALGEPAEPQETAIRRHTEQWVQSIDPAASVPTEPDADWLVAPQPPMDDPEDTSWLAAFADTPSSTPAASESADDWLHTIEDNINEVADARTIATRPEDLRRQLGELGLEDAPVSSPTDGGSGLTGLLNALTNDGPADDEQPTGDTPHSGVTGLLDALATEEKVPTESLTDDEQLADLDPFDFDAFDTAQTDDASTVGLTGLLGQLSGGDESAEMPGTDTEVVSGPLEDPFAWMAQENIELVDPAPDDIRRFREGGIGTGALAPLDPAQDDALAWARNSGVVLEDDESALPEEDPFAWLRAEGIEVITDDLPEPSAVAESPSTITVEEVLPLSEKDTGQLPPAVTQEPPAASADVAEQTNENNGLTGLLALMGGGARLTSSEDRPTIGGEMANQQDEMPDWLRATGDAESDDALGVDDGALDWLIGLDGNDDADKALSEELDISALVEDNPVSAESAPSSDESDADDLPIPDWMAELKDERDPNELVKVSTVETPAIIEALTVDEADSGFFPTLEEDEPVAGGHETPILDAEQSGEAPVSGDVAEWVLLPPPETAAVRSSPSEAVIMPAVTYNPHDDLLLAASLSQTPEAAPISESPLTHDEPLVLDNESDFLGEASATPADSRPLFDDEPLALEDESGLMDADAAGEVDWLSAMASHAPSSHSVIETNEMGTLDDLSAAFDPAPAASSDDFSFGALDFDDQPAKQEDDAFSLDFFDTLDEGETSGANTLVLDDDPLPDAILDERGSFPFDFDMDVPANQLNDSSALFGEVLDNGDVLMVDPEPADALSETAAVSAPDWLNALAPGLEVDAEAVDSLTDEGYLGGARGDYGWLVSLVDEELRPPSVVPMRRGPRFVFDQPPLWLQAIREQTRQIPALKDADDDALPDWLRGIEDDAK